VSVTADIQLQDGNFYWVHTIASDTGLPQVFYTDAACTQPIIASTSPLVGVPYIMGTAYAWQLDGGATPPLGARAAYDVGAPTTTPAGIIWAGGTPIDCFGQSYIPSNLYWYESAGVRNPSSFVAYGTGHD
jgi:hypothetical protein